MLVRLGDPGVVPGFHGAFLHDMPSSKTAGSPPAAFAQFFTNDFGFRPDLKGSTLPSAPIIRFGWVVVFAATRLNRWIVRQHPMIDFHRFQS